METGLNADSAEAYCKCALRGAKAEMSERAMARPKADLAQGKTLPDSVVKITGACRASSSAH